MGLSLLLWRAPLPVEPLARVVVNETLYVNKKIMNKGIQMELTDLLLSLINSIILIYYWLKKRLFKVGFRGVLQLGGLVLGYLEGIFLCHYIIVTCLETSSR